ncbi:hypothetical protein ACLVMG_04015 [Streptococcus pneumoniae]|nr:hypothetical protein [Streptococcus pneumoniae]
MKIKEQTRKCSKHSLEVVDKTDEVSSKYGFELVDKTKLMWFEEIFEEYKKIGQLKSKLLTFSD